MEGIRRRFGRKERLWTGTFPEIPLPFYEVDLDGRLMRVSRAACELLGYRESQMAAYPVWRFLYPETQEAARMEILRRVSGAASGPFEQIFVRRQGPTVTVETRQMPIYNYMKDPVGMRCFMLEPRRTEKDAAQGAAGALEALAALDAFFAAASEGVADRAAREHAAAAAARLRELVEEGRAALMPRKPQSLPQRAAQGATQIALGAS